MKLFGASASLLLILLPVAAEDMNLVKLHIDSFTIVGIQVRTSNAQERKESSIGRLWERLAAENLLDRIRYRADTHVVAVYNNYESDKDGPYTYTLGAKVTSDRDAPDGMNAVTVLSGDYAMFTAQGGAPPQMTVDLWKRIWSLEKPGPLHRAYKTDFEVHYSAQGDPADSRIDVYIGVVK
ncbi:MAG: AraC family transcriptional regulator [Acidobacteriaceae bacterium]|nr:AraC family transcriptional regulator [Acidobacteriaceae bacterium]